MKDEKIKEKYAEFFGKENISCYNGGLSEYVRKVCVWWVCLCFSERQLIRVFVLMPKNKKGVNTDCIPDVKQFGFAYSRVFRSCSRIGVFWASWIRIVGCIGRPHTRFGQRILVCPSQRVSWWTASSRTPSQRVRDWTGLFSEPPSGTRHILTYAIGFLHHFKRSGMRMVLASIETGKTWLIQL